jgi:hypothetical protein
LFQGRNSEGRRRMTYSVSSHGNDNIITSRLLQAFDYASPRNFRRLCIQRPAACTGHRNAWIPSSQCRQKRPTSNFESHTDTIIEGLAN